MRLLLSPRDGLHSHYRRALEHIDHRHRLAKAILVIGMAGVLLPLSQPAYSFVQGCVCVLFGLFIILTGIGWRTKLRGQEYFLHLNPSFGYMTTTLSGYVDLQEQEVHENFKHQYPLVDELLVSSDLDYRLIVGPTPETAVSRIVFYRSYGRKEHRCSFSLQPDGTLSTKSHGLFSEKELLIYLAAETKGWDTWATAEKWYTYAKPWELVLRILFCPLALLLILFFVTSLVVGVGGYQGDVPRWAPLAAGAGSILLFLPMFWLRKKLNRKQADWFGESGWPAQYLEPPVARE